MYARLVAAFETLCTSYHREPIPNLDLQEQTWRDARDALVHRLAEAVLESLGRLNRIQGLVIWLPADTPWNPAGDSMATRMSKGPTVVHRQLNLTPKTKRLGPKWLRIGITALPNRIQHVTDAMSGGPAKTRGAVVRCASPHLGL